jgi:molybdopterin molybdotransferase
MVAPRTHQRIARLTPLADAIGCIERLVPAVAPRPIEVGAAFGCTLAAPVMASDQRPATALALRDGWALAAEATLDAGSYAPAALAAVPIAVQVGDPLAANADAVAPVEAVEIRGAVANALLTVAPGEGVLARGADVSSGALLLSAGRRLSRTDIAVLKATGASTVSVREPRVRIAAARPGADVIIDSIVALVCDGVETDGVAIRCEATSADAHGLDGVLRAEDADAVMIVGGSGAGERDHSVEALARLGQLAFHGVGLTPGETAAFGMVGRRPVLVVPGRFDAALAVWLVLGRRMLALMSGRIADEPTWPGTLTRKVTSTVGLADVIVARRNGNDIVPLASEYLSPQALARADGWFLVPADLEGFPAGASVAIKSLP